LQAVGQAAHRRLAVGLDLEEVDDLLDELAVLGLLALGRTQREACWKMLVFIFRLRPVMRLSMTFMPLNSARFWKVRATPISATWRLFMWLKVLPRKVMLPSCGAYTPLMQLSMLLLPAPLGPMMARTRARAH
jgi:hypothetical protein